MSTTKSLSHGEPYVAIHDSSQFNSLRHRFQRFAGPAAAIFLGWWFVAILLGAFAPGFYRQTVSVGMLVILGTFVLVLIIAALYLRYARAQLDPLADQLRADAEGGPR